MMLFAKDSQRTCFLRQDASLIGFSER